jgi:hypothetical protein
MVCGSLAVRLLLPCPAISLINITSELIQVSPGIRDRNISAGLHFGSRRLPNNTADFQQLDPKIFVDHTLLNPNDLYGVTCFDNWVLNTDRNNTGNNMIEILPGKKLKYYMIDFGHCLKSNVWGMELQQSINDQNLAPHFEFFKNYINDFNKFQAWCNLIEQFPENDIRGLVDSLPPSWAISNEEKEILKNLIGVRKKSVISIITNNREVLGV